MQGNHSGGAADRYAAGRPGKLRTADLGTGRRGGDDRTLDRQAVLLLAVQGLVGIANALSGTFLPIYLWKESQSLALIGWFNFTLYAVSGLTFWIAGKWVKEHNKMNSLRLGVALSGVFYFVVLLLGKWAVACAMPLGALNGMAMGFFWLAYNVVYFEITEPGNRDRFNGWAGLLAAGAGIVVPWTSGVIITAFAGERGYSVIFTISAVIFAAAALLSFRLHKREKGGSYDWLYGVRQLSRPDSPWRRIVPAIAAQGVREGVFMFLIALLIYLATHNEKKLGDFSFLTSLVALAGFWLIGKLLTPARRRWAMLLGALALTAVIFPLFVRLSYGPILLFGLGTALFMPLFAIPITSVVFDMIGRDEESVSRREEFVVLREAGLTAGRLVGIGAYLAVLPFVDRLPQTVPILMLAVGAFPILSWIFIRSCMKGNGPTGGKAKRERDIHTRLPKL